MEKVHVLLIGSGAAGLCAAVRLDALGVDSLILYTEGLRMGTSLNTGSDKQTYYKLGMYGAEADSPADMARDLMAGGSMHGDTALVEASTSSSAFAHLCHLGVPFPHDAYGQYIGYKTDHDPRRRATSCGPYTSRDMCRCLHREVERRGIRVEERQVCVRLLTDPERTRCLGAIFVHTETGVFTAVQADEVVFAVGGPGGLYETSVYPPIHTGGIGLALEAGATAANLSESQFGLASLGFRWNVSGSYMQVLPRFVSVDSNGEEREFLRDYFATPGEMYDAIFLKGYQWPFSVGHVPGSSLIDIFTYIETAERGRRVYLDYRDDPADFSFDRLGEETRTYLEKCGCLCGKPFERLLRMNEPAVRLYREHGIDLAERPLEIAVCAQHNNGGLAVDIWWESVSLRHLFPIGEVAGTHGVTRPGGTALNAGQVGAFRAAERIAARGAADPCPDTSFAAAAEAALRELREAQARPGVDSWRRERGIFQHRMTRDGAFVRSEASSAAAFAEARTQYERLLSQGLGGLTPPVLAETLRNRQLCLAHVFYLAAVHAQTRQVGSRGGALVRGSDGVCPHPALPEAWRVLPEDRRYRRFVQLCQAAVPAHGEAPRPEISWEPCRPLPESNGWFETVWKQFRNGSIHHRQSSAFE